MNSVEEIRKKTVKDFGDQWGHFTDSNGLYGDPSFLQDIFGPLLSIEDINNKSVIDIGSGSGRICEMLVKNGASHVYGIEPAEKAFKVLEENLKQYKNFSAINVMGDSIPKDITADLVLSIGVIHHIKEPASTLKAAYEATKDGGKAIIWIYGKEGNFVYLVLFKFLHFFTTKMSHKALHNMCKILKYPLNLYTYICKKLPLLPMSSYFINVIDKWEEDVKVLTIYDQLNPQFSHYYTKEEIIREMESAGFRNVKAYHRHGYSWTVLGEK